MKRYFYSAQSVERGSLVSGTVEAPNEHEARIILAKRGLEWAQLRRERDLSSWVTRLRLLSPPSLIHLALATRQLSVMLNSGIDVVRSLDVLQMADYGPRLNLAWSDLANHVNKGYSLSRAMARHPGVFSPVFTGLVKAGESSGSLVSNLNSLADHLERELRLRQKLSSALVYPAFVFGICCLAILLLTQKVLPTLINGVFKETGTNLPLITQSVVYLGNLLNSAWFFHIVLPVLLFGLLFSVHYARTPGGRYRMQWILKRIPGVKLVLRAAAAARFSRTMGSLNACGIPLVHSLELTDMVLSDYEMSFAIDKIIAGVEEGESFAELLRSSEAFPAIVVGFTELGQETGSLAKAYKHLSEMLEEEIDLLLNTLMSALEPLMIGVMGAFVGYIVIAMFLPLYQMLNGV
ncbi:type II secretion system F family protein [bacterium]|nr:type II secretion system F family protein [bacterium]